MPDPILENNARLIIDKLGKTTHVTAKLFFDHLELQDTNGTILLNMPLSNLTNVIHKDGLLSSTNAAIKFDADGHNYFLYLLPISQQFSALFGVIGIILSSNRSGSGQQIAKSWVQTMEQNGVHFN